MDNMKFFLTKRIVGGIVLVILVLWGANVMFNKIGPPSATTPDEAPALPEAQSAVTGTVPETAPVASEVIIPSAVQATPPVAAAPTAEPPVSNETVSSAPPAGESGKIKGPAFLDAVIKPLDYELNDRFWGWRSNDLINITDNVNNYQRGVLEVSRRAVRILTERISRTGNTISFNKNLENAMNGLGIKADAFMFPSSEDKYQEALDELNLYKKALEEGNESFYSRTDNLIPLLQVFEDLLGSCEENLVKKTEKDGSTVGFSASDNYFFYAKGVAGAMKTILEAVLKDFDTTLESRRGIEVLNNAIASLQRAEDIDPLIILNSDPDSLWANHRANMAAPISHAKFYIEVLITALST